MDDGQGMVSGSSADTRVVADDSGDRRSGPVADTDERKRRTVVVAAGSCEFFARPL
jgi:hypothetical protein